MGRTGESGTLGWLGILRLGLVQASLGAIVVLTTSTLNRVMVVELGLAAIVPGLLVGAHYAVQLARPVWGHGSDRGGRRAPWIVGGMAALALGGVGAALATALMAHAFAAGFALALAAFVAIGAGVGAAGTALLALLASAVAPERRAAAATTAWLMMIAGIVVTAVVSGALLDPFSFGRLAAVTAGVGAVACTVTVLAVWGIERGTGSATAGREAGSFRDSLSEAWSDGQARLFTVFVFVSMIAYSMQDLILEPYAGLVFGMTPGETTKLSGLQNGGVLAGMLLVGAAGSLGARRFPGVLGFFTVAGCLLSAAALAGLGLSAASPAAWPLSANVLALGFGNGVFTVGAIASMMSLAGRAGSARAGLRMGLWGAAQGVAFGLGGFTGTALVGALRLDGFGVEASYGGVFLAEAAIFVAASFLAARIAATRRGAEDREPPLPALQAAE